MSVGTRGQHRARLAVTVVAALALTAGCLGAPGASPSADDATPSPSVSPTAAEPTAAEPTTAEPTAAEPTDSPKLASVLADVASASDPAAVAEARGLRTQDGRVLVVVELRPEQSLPATPPVEVTSRSDDAVVGYVAYADLQPLAAHENVSLVRPPNEVSQ